jgi:hypothetical protein
MEYVGFQPARGRFRGIAALSVRTLPWLGLWVSGPTFAVTVEVAPTLEYIAYDRDTAPRGPYASEEEALNVVLPTYVQQYYFPSIGETRYYDYPAITDKSPYTKTINGNWSWSRTIYMSQRVRSVFDNGNSFEHFISINTAGMFYYKCAAGYSFKENFSTWEIGQPGPTCVGEDECPEGKLTTTHVSYPLNTEDLTQRAKDAVSCLESCSGQSRSAFLSSAYRPSVYQDHLREVWNKWKKLKDDTRPACAALKAKVKKEFDDHGLGASTLPPSRTSCHTEGGCVDVDHSFTETVDFCSTQCSVYRPWPYPPPAEKSDPVHVVPY